jgi:predicted dehydrogenase
VSAAPRRVLQWGLLGTARINRSVIPPLRASKRNRLVAVASRSAERARAYAKEWRIERAVGSYRELLGDPAIDVIYNPLPNALHAEWTIAAVRAGKHVLCEKPLATTIADVDVIAAEARAHGRVVAEAFMYRHHPQTALVQRLVAEGAVGEVRLMQGCFRFMHGRDDDVRWLLEMGGGSLWDVGCYPVSFARLVMQEEPAEVMGWQRLTPGGVDDTFVGQLRFASGAFLTFDSSFRAPFATGFEVAGTGGAIRPRVPYKPGKDAPVDVIGPDGTARVVRAEGQDLYSGEIEDMARAIIDGAPPRISLADSRGNAATIVALYESARTGRPVAIPREW